MMATPSRILVSSPFPLFLRQFAVSAIVLFLVSGLASAQQAAPSASLPRLCIATVHNETKFDVAMPKLRDLLVSQIRQGNLARNGRLEVLQVDGDTEESATSEVGKQRCDFVVYERLTLFKVAAEAPKLVNPYAIKGTQPAEVQVVPGIQFTVIRIQSGMPILIDRRVSARPYSSESDITTLLQAIGDSVEAALEKRLLAPAKPAS